MYGVSAALARAMYGFPVAGGDTDAGSGTDAIVATSNSCAHKGGPLSEGIVHDRKVTCPLHNWVYSLETGEAQGADQGQIASYPVRIEAGRVLLDAESLARRSAA